MNLILDNRHLIHQGLKGVFIGSAVMVLILSVLLLGHLFQSKAVDPINSPALKTLMEHLEENPNDQAVKEQIRALDLLARKAYFTSQWQLRTGGFILLGAAVLLMAALKGMETLNKKLPSPDGCADADDTWLTAIKARKWIAFGGTFLMASSLIAAFLSHGDIGNTDFGAAAVKISQEDLLKNWTNFRGPGGNGVAHTDKAPTHWDVDTGENIAWRVETPLKGFSSPIVWQDKVFVTGGNKTTRQVYCYHAATGELIWTHDVTDVPGTSSKAPDVHSDTGYAPSTMSTDGRVVFAIFPNGDLVGLDMDGNRVWGKSLGTPDNHYGHSSSLINYKNLLIVQWDQNRGSKLLALDAASGEEVWQQGRTVISWSSPIIVNTGSRDELILTNSMSLDSYDPSTGRKLWGQEVLGGEMGPSAAYADGMVFGANDFAVVAGVQILKDGSAELVWEYDENLPDTASPLATDKHLYIACSYGYMICLDAKTGEFLWEKETDGGFYSTPILVGDKIYALDLQGNMYIFEDSGDEYKSIAQLSIGDNIAAASPAFAGGRMFVRGDKHLVCIGK